MGVGLGLRKLSRVGDLSVAAAGERCPVERRGRLLNRALPAGVLGIPQRFENIYTMRAVGTMRLGVYR